MRLALTSIRLAAVLVFSCSCGRNADSGVNRNSEERLAAANGTFRNPLNGAPDPYMTYYAGNYYLATTQFDVLRLWKASTLGELLTGESRVVWRDSDGSRNRDMWAPSVYFIDGRWYIYYTADDGIDDHHRLYVVESEGADPFGPYHFKGKLEAPGSENTWAIDAALLFQNGRTYVAWSGKQDATYNLLFIAPMSNPWTISGPRTFLAGSGGCPEVREAPSFVQHGGRTFLVYSACDTGKPDYQLWMKSIPDTADPTDASRWQQHPASVFARNDATGTWGPGSNAFFKSPDGSEDWFVYHAKNTTAFTYDGRTTRAQKLGWNADGTPHFGAPLAAGATADLPSGDPGGGPYWINDTGTSSGAGSVQFSSGWTAFSTCGVQCFWGDDHGSARAGATATFTFEGTGIDLLSVRDTGNGIAAFSLDGGSETTADYYASIRQGEQLVYASPRVPFGRHTLRVRVTGSKSPTSTGTAISIDRAEVHTR
ncbi:glycoside hydrolase family 43 protein [Pendulispora rubella]|uniref:Glycoside hydrolase family 43 protein n=1 Tax=Pendulispora rubella TaxID=2741070 RepID=A0ABZ2KX23_9BACT